MLCSSPGTFPSLISCNPGHSPISQMEKPRCLSLAQIPQSPTWARPSELEAHRRWAWGTFSEAVFGKIQCTPSAVPLSPLLKSEGGTSLVVQWLRVHLPMQGTRVWALVWEDPTCRGATGPVSHNCWACALEPASHNYWSLHVTTTEARVPRAHAPQQEKPPQWEARAPQWRVASARCN